MSTKPPEPTLEERIESLWRAHLETLPFKIPPPSVDAFRAGYLSREAEDADRRHLETAATYLYNKMTRNPEWYYAPELHAWLEVERIRRQKRGSDGK